MLAFKGSMEFSNLSQEQCLQIVTDPKLKRLRDLGSETQMKAEKTKKKLDLVEKINEKRSHSKWLNLQAKLNTELKFLYQKIEHIQNEISNTIERMIYEENNSDSD